MILKKLSQPKNLKKLCCLFSAFLLSFCFICAAPSTFAANNSDRKICEADKVPDEVRKASGCENNKDDLSDSIIAILNAIIGVIGIVAVIFVIIGGINYMTSQGDAQKAIKARNTILYACIGLIVCALAFSIVNFVISNIIYQKSSNDPSTTPQTTTQNND